MFTRPARRVHGRIDDREGMRITGVLAILVLATLPGCLIHAQQQTKTVQLGTVQGAAREVTKPRLRMDATAVSSTVLVRAYDAVDCARSVYALSEARTEKTATMDAMDLGPGGAGGGPGAVLVLGVLAIGAVTGIISGTATMIELAADRPRVERYAKLVRVERVACARSRAGQGIDLLLASGTSLRGTTDSRGMVRFSIPAGEVAQGVVTIVAGDRQTQVAYSRQADERCDSARLAMLDRINGETDPARRAALVRATPTCSTTDRENTLWAMTQTAALAALDHKCGTARDVGDRIRVLDRGHFDVVFAQHAAIADCLYSSER